MAGSMLDQSSVPALARIARSSEVSSIVLSSANSPPLKWAISYSPKKPPCAIASKSDRKRLLNASGRVRVLSTSLVKRPCGRRRISSAKRQKRRRIRKWAASSGLAPRLRRLSASRANSAAAFSVTWAAVLSGLSRSGSVKTARSTSIGESVLPGVLSDLERSSRVKR